MNSNQRRKLEAQQHNDARRYENWLAENTQGQRVTPRVKKKLTLGTSLLSAAMLMAYGSKFYD